MTLSNNWLFSCLECNTCIMVDTFCSVTSRAICTIAQWPAVLHCIQCLWGLLISILTSIHYLPSSITVGWMFDEARNCSSPLSASLKWWMLACFTLQIIWIKKKSDAHLWSFSGRFQLVEIWWQISPANWGTNVLSNIFCHDLAKWLSHFLFSFSIFFSFIELNHYYKGAWLLTPIPPSYMVVPKSNIANTHSFKKPINPNVNNTRVRPDDTCHKKVTTK